MSLTNASRSYTLSDVAVHIAQEQGIPFDTPTDLLNHPDFLKIVETRVQARNQKLDRFETIKKYRIIQREFSQEMGELTPSLKLKRNVVLRDYAGEIAAIYAK